MSRLQIEVPDGLAEELRRRADERGLSVSQYVRELLQREAADVWPEHFFDRVAGGWSGEPLARPSQGAFEEREQL